MKCPKCGKELRVVNISTYECINENCDDNGVALYIETLALDWQSRAEKAEGELARVWGITAEMEKYCKNAVENGDGCLECGGEYAKTLGKWILDDITLIKGGGK